MASRLITPVLEEILKSYPLYSQDGKGKDAVCVAIFFIGHVRWFVLEGQPEGNDTTCSPSYAVCMKRSMAIPPSMKWRA